MQRTPRFLLSALALVIAGNAVATDTAAETPVQNSELNGEMFYQLLVGELSAQSGDVSTAFVLMLDAARKAQSEKLYERTVELALRARSGESALQSTQAWLRAFPRSAQANRYQLQILIGLNRLSETVGPIQRELASLTPQERAQAIQLLPRYFAQVPDLRQAAQVLERALTPELSSTDFGPGAWASVGRMRLLAQDTDGAVDAVRRGMDKNPRAEEPALLALDLLDAKSAAAEELLKKHLAVSPHKGIRLAYVRKLLQIQRFADALTQSELLTVQHPDNAEVWLIRGSLEFQTNALEKAHSSLQTFLRLTPAGSPPSSTPAPDTEPGMAQALLLLAQIAERQQKPDEASALLSRVVGEQYALRVQTRRASLLARQGKLEEARALIRALPEKSPDDAREKLAVETQLLRDAKAFEAAYVLLGRAIAKAPQDVELVYDQAMIAERLGKFEEMEQLLRRVIAIKPDYYHAYNALGYSLADRNKNLPEARQLLSKALEFAPNDPYILDSMAWLEFRSANYPEALRLLQVAYQARPDAEIAAHLGEVLWASGNPNHAKAIWNEGRKLSPDNEVLLQTIQRLSGTP